MSFLYSLKEILTEILDDWYISLFVIVLWGFLKLLVRYDKVFLFKAIAYISIFGIIFLYLAALFYSRH